MAEFKPTPSQEAAINTRGRAVLVSAAAGSGKTKVLTERLLSRITDESDPVDVDSFLIITFTNAAAAELRSRISDEISARLAVRPDDNRLRRQSALCRRAQIGTIHSFCSTLLREHCHAAGLSPEFRVIEEERAEAIKARVIEKVMDARYESMDEDFKLLSDTVGRGRDDSRLSKLVIELHKKIQSHARPDEWAQKQIEALSGTYTDAGETAWGREVLSSLKLDAAFWTEKLEELCLAMQSEEKIAKAYSASISETARQLRELCRALDLGWDEARKRLPIEYPRLGTLRSSPNEELSDRIKSIRKKCKTATDGYEKILGTDSAKLIDDMRKTAPAMRALLRLTLEFDRVYAEDKRRRAEVDFSDLEHMAYRLLTEQPEIARATAMKFTEIMVDEYQDVNAVQDAIFRAVSRKGENLFMVGDVKQSIYRFRLADPTIFTEKYLSFSDLDTAEGNSPVRIMLQENFRSRSQVLNAANHVFRTCMSRTLGDIDYDSRAELRCGAGYDGETPVPELLLLSLPGGKDEDSPDKTALEAAMAAGKIKSLIDAGTPVTDHGVIRPARYGDVAILMRSANTTGNVYRRALLEAGVPVMNGQGGSFFDSAEISDIMSLLAVIDNPRQDIPLIAVLRSPLFGFSADELSQIRGADKRRDFFTALKKHAEENEKCADFINRLSELRKQARDLELGEFICRLYGELDAMAIYSAMVDGENRCGNLMSVLEYAKRFEHTGFHGLHRFVEWLLKLREKGDEPVRGASGDAVQIMTVHKSKGLEFPIVFLCDTNHGFNRMELRDPVLVHPELGLGSKLTDTERGIEYPTLPRNAIEQRSDRELLSEEMRLLYVALTRAKEYLFITAGMKDPEGELQKLRDYLSVPMSPVALMKANSPVKWLMYSALTDSCGCIKLRICSAGPENAEIAEPEERTTDREIDDGLLETLRHNLSFSYPCGAATELPSKVTATEMKSREEPDPDARNIAPQRSRTFRRPELLSDGLPVTGTEKGTATHTVLQFIDYSKTGDTESVRSEIARLRANRFISDRQAEVVDADAILKLFRSETGRRIMNADSVRREFKFSLLCPASDFFENGAGENVLLQGVMDCCIEENGALTVIDYKTDRVKGAALHERAKVYEGQLRAYAIAAERIMGKPVKECVLYFLHAGEAVSIRIREK